MITTTIYLLSLICLYLAYYLLDINDDILFIILNSLFSLFVIIKIISFKRKKFFYINPIILGAVFMFLLPYGFPFLIGREYCLINDNVDTHYLILAMVYVNIAFITMWHSFSSIQMKSIAEATFNYITIKGTLLRDSYRLNIKIVSFLFALFILSALIQIKSGTFGYLSAFYDSKPIMFASLLNLFSFSGTGVIFLLMLLPNLSPKGKTYMYILFFINLFFQILSGFKGAVIRAFLVVFIADYLKSNKLNYKIILLSLISIYFSYSIVEGYRIMVQYNTRESPKSIKEIVDLNVKGLKLVSSVIEKQDEIPTYIYFISRFSTLSELANFINYKEKTGLRSKSDPNFAYRVFTIPLQIILPEALWKNKPKENLGSIWVNERVFGNKNTNSLAFGSIGFLYLLGGSFAIIMGFIFIAFIFKLIDCFLYSNSFGGIIVAFVLIAFSYSMEGSFNSYVVILIRFLFLAIIFQRFIIKNERV